MSEGIQILITMFVIIPGFMITIGLTLWLISKIFEFLDEKFS